ncbi:MAG: FAD-dependent oxidoreductase [Acidobacteria bacterium]|nr:FAD-dependent oxidoreductase [Acidobacteriota bacterium]
MARIVILGGGFAGVVAAESLAQKLDKEHEITLIARQREFTFYPDLVRLAFGQCRTEDVFFDLEGALLAQRIRFIQAEIIAPDPLNDTVMIRENGHERHVPYDFLVMALGRRLAIEEVKGFQQHAHHLLSVGAALRFGEAVKNFKAGHAIIGACPETRLAVPVFETAFALDRALSERGERKAVNISLVLPEKFSANLGGEELASALQKALALHEINVVTDFPIDLISEKEIWARDNRRMPYDLLMLLPPFAGPDEAAYRGLTDETGFIQVGWDMKVRGARNVYAAGDCVSLLGPKMGHLAVLQGEIVAANLAAEIAGRQPEARYEHEIELIINEGGNDSLYLHKELWTGAPPVMHQGRFWSWAKQIHSHYWTRQHQLNPISKARS